MWSGWGIAVLGIAFAALVGSALVADALTRSFAMAYGPAASAGCLISGVAATVLIDLLAKWRESKPARTLVDEATGERFEFGGNAGDLLFIPVRYWSWIMLALTALLTLSLYDAQPPPDLPSS